MPTARDLDFGGGGGESQEEEGKGGGAEGHSAAPLPHTLTGVAHCVAAEGGEGGESRSGGGGSGGGGAAAAAPASCSDAQPAVTSATKADATAAETEGTAVTAEVPHAAAVAACDARKLLHEMPDAGGQHAEAADAKPAGGGSIPSYFEFSLHSAMKGKLSGGGGGVTQQLKVEHIFGADLPEVHACGIYVARLALGVQRARAPAAGGAAAARLESGGCAPEGGGGGASGSSSGESWLGDVMMKQTGVFRINCIDCLDRTNVAMSLLARRFLYIYLNTHSLSHTHILSLFLSFSLSLSFSLTHGRTTVAM